MATVTTSHYKIFDYWRDQAIKSDGQVVTLDTDYDLIIKNIVIDEDWYYPRCWGCGEPILRDSKIDNWIDKQCVDDDEESNLKRIWNSKETRSRLNRCHIIPGALGGADEPSNLFLMCSECHSLSPDTKYPSRFFKWVLERRKHMLFGTFHPNYILQQTDVLLKRDYGIGLTDLLKRIHELSGDNSLPNLREFMENRIGTHCTKITESSAIIAVEQWLVLHYTNLALKCPSKNVANSLESAEQRGIIN